MALILCPECEGKVSTLAKCCPHCGFPINCEKVYTEYSNKIQKLSSLQKGDKFFFGLCQQDSSDTTSLSDIEWMVLKRTKNLCLIISKYCLDVRQYHNEKGEICWEKSSIRKWLNERFYVDCFSEEEKSIILTLLSTKQKMEVYYDFENHNMSDKVFLLTANEFGKMVPDVESALRLTKYANLRLLQTKNRDQLTTLNKGAIAWWLHQPYGYYTNAPIVTNGGCYKDSWMNFTHEFCGIRPAMWIEVPDETKE